MQIVLIATVAAIASLLTFFSGFGLGTILTPVLLLFFPVEIAIALSGIVHLLNNLFKITLTGKNINWKTGMKFGLPAIAGAFAGAQVLLLIPETTILYSYSIGEKIIHILPLKLMIACLMLFFALFEIIPALKKVQFSENKLYLGGLLSGFFGGLSGNQGALRSAFLLKTSLTKESFIATGILIACLVDFTRLSVYFSRLTNINLKENGIMLLVTVLSAFGGAFLGSKVLKKVTFGFVQGAVTVLIFLLAVMLGLGFI